MSIFIFCDKENHTGNMANGKLEIINGVVKERKLKK
jgi:hypothetical protein